jgi:hypothetical protein
MGLAEFVMAITLSAAAGAAGQGQAAQPGAPAQDVDAQLLADLELLQMLDMLRDLDTLRQMDEVLGAARAEKKPGQGSRGKTQ